MTACIRQPLATPPWLALLMLLLGGAPAQATEEYALLQVAEPFIELHTGPGVGYPVFHVVDRAGFIEVLKRKTDW
ncbi:MAG TPA: hypothetical protein ENK51_00830, partial [Gammaproteobacteria bacterium]|nr:hypothetical protein [Gammaproteobacteria bacterium]